MEATPSSSTSNVNEIKLAEGIYFTDYRRSVPITNSCQSSLIKKKEEIPKHPELIIALLKENDNRAEKLVYSIAEIKKMDNYQEDQDFMLAIKEDYEILLRVLDFEVRALQELERLDRYSPYLKQHTVKSIQNKIAQYTQESMEFEDEYNAIYAKNNPAPVIPTQDEKIEVTPPTHDEKDEDKNSVYI